MRHIIAIGGLLPSGNEPLIDYSLKLTGRSCPRLGFFGTASGDAETYRLRFEQLARGLQCVPSTLPFFSRTPDVAAWVEQQDVILVGGGNTRSMLAVWREWRLPDLLRRAWENGTVLTGWSAGAICWFDQGVTDSCADRLAALDCLGFLRGSCCPHFSGEPERRPAYDKLIEAKQICAGIAIDDGAGVHYVDDRPYAIVALGPHPAAYAVDAVAGSVKETPLAVPRLDLLSAR
jgi:dipeptidase E